MRDFFIQLLKRGILILEAWVARLEQYPDQPLIPLLGVIAHYWTGINERSSSLFSLKHRSVKWLIWGAIAILAAIALMWKGSSFLISTPTPSPLVVVPSPQFPLPTPVPTPSLPPLLIPLQRRITEATGSLSFGQLLVETIQVNYSQGLLTIVLNEKWYTLSIDQQNQLAQTLLRQSGELSFTNLEIRNQSDQLLARSPVVGNEMIILKRSDER
ncbi:MAG: hypothetical protein LVT47_11190 [Cyanobacteria bacterium LVE1205-1]